MANSIDEFVPADGALKLQKMLLDFGVPTTVQLVSGTLHAKGYMTNAIDASISFLETFLKNR